MGYCVRSRTFSKRWVGKVWAAFALSLGVAGAALAQTAPAVDVKVRWPGGLPQPYGPSEDAWATAYCQNLGTAQATGVQCGATLKMRANDGSVVDRTIAPYLCEFNDGSGAPLSGPYVLQPAGMDGDGMECRFRAPLGGQMGGADFGFTDARYVLTTSAANESQGFEGNNTFVYAWTPIYDAISDTFTHVAGTAKSYDLLANDQAGNAGPMKPVDPAQPDAVRWGSVCMRRTMAGYKTDATNPAALNFHSSVFTSPAFDPLSIWNTEPSMTLPLGVKIQRNGLLVVPASLPPGEYDLFYVYGTGVGSASIPAGYTDDGQVFYGGGDGCDPVRDYAVVKLRVVAPVPVQVPTLEFGALAMLVALLGVAGMGRQQPKRRG